MCYYCDNDTIAPGNMTEELANKWADELESGKYMQGQESLRYGDEFCCLGVLSEMAVEAGVCEQMGSATFYSYDSSVYLLPPSIQKWAGMRSSDGKFSGYAGDRASTLSAMNDNGKSFAEIAKFIRENYQKL